MLYIGYQVTPLPGKSEELIAASARCTKVAEANGAKQIGGFRVILGEGVGNLIFIESYADGDAYIKAMSAVNQSSDSKQLGGLIASSASAVLQPLADSALQ